MSTDSFRFKVGTFDCISISDGKYTYAPPTFPPPPVFLFANAHRDRLKHVLHEYGLQEEQWVEWISPYICQCQECGLVQTD